MGVLFLDNFNRADAGSPGASYGHAGGIDYPIVSNQLSSSSGSCAAVYLDQTVSNGYVQVRLTGGAGNTFMVIALTLGFSDLSINRYDFTLDGTAGTARLRKADGAGSKTTLVSGIALPTNGQVIRLRHIGTTLAVDYDGVQQASTTDSDFSGPFYGSVNAGPGSGVTNTDIDDFEFGSGVKTLTALGVG